jgi:HK97 family phage portal protein
MFWNKILKNHIKKNEENINKNLNKNEAYFVYLKETPSYLLEINCSKLEEIYKTNTTIFRCIHLISECANSMKIHSNNKKLFNYLNINFENIITNLLLYGNCFLHKDLFILPIQHISILSNPNTKEIIGYKDKFNTYNVHEVLHLKYCSNPGNFYSISPSQVAIKWVDISNHIQNYINLMMETGGRQSGILSHGNIIQEREKQILKDEFNDLYKKLSYDGKAMFSQGKVEWQPIGYEPDKLQLIDHWNNAVKEIANCFGVPIILLGSKDTSNFSNYENARKYLWEDLVIPFILNIIHKIEIFYEVKIKLNTQNIEILNEKIWQHDLLTVNEKRQLLGYEPIKNGDCIQNLKKKDI